MLKTKHKLGFKRSRHSLSKRRSAKRNRFRRISRSIDGMLTKQLQIFLAEKDFPAEAGKSGGADLIVKKNGDDFGIFVRFAIPDHHQMLGLGLDIKKREKFKWCFVVVQVLSDQDKSFNGLFAEFQVSIVEWDTLPKELRKKTTLIEELLKKETVHCDNFTRTILIEGKPPRPTR
jgi:hypothetical protein